MPVVLLITTPPADATIERGRDARFSVEAQGAEPLEYQWQFERTDLPGEDAPTLTLLHVTPAQAGLYRVRVRDSNGSVLSSEARLSVTEPPEVGWITIAIEAEGTITLCWQALIERTYSVWVARDSAGPYTLLISGLTEGSHTDAVSGGDDSRYYRVSSP